MAATRAATTAAVILVTGFGPFPGAPENPTLAVLDDLESSPPAGALLSVARLPVTFAGIRSALAEAAHRTRPDALLMLGLATRREILSVETTARNRVGRSVRDTADALPTSDVLVPGAPDILHTTWPAPRIAAALLDAGQAAALSDDAGDYVCNAALFHALDDGLAPIIGFLHVPPIGVGGTHSASLAAAARLAIGVLVETAMGPNVA